jgi:hypothetical protein
MVLCDISDAPSPSRAQRSSKHAFQNEALEFCLPADRASLVQPLREHPKADSVGGACRHALPEKYQDLMVNPKSKIIDFYPKTFAIDMNGKKMWVSCIKALCALDCCYVCHACVCRFRNSVFFVGSAYSLVQLFVLLVLCSVHQTEFGHFPCA